VTDKPASEIVEEAERASEDRSKALVEARRMRTATRTLSELRARNEALQGAVDVLEEHMQVREALREAIKKPPVLKSTRKEKRDAIIPIAFNSDEHYDEEFTLEQTGGINEQNPEIAEAKVHTYVRRLIRLIEREALDNPVPYLVMPFMGDMIAGELHPKSERETSMTPTEASRFAYRMKRTIIDSLLATDLPRLVIPCVDGNHGRTTAKRTPGLNQRYSHEHDVYLRLADHYLESGARVEFYVPERDFVSLDVADGFRLCITHGDSLRGGSGIGGLAPPLLRGVSRWRQAYPANLYGLGHFHQLVDLGGVVVNPAAVGFNPFAAALGLDPGDSPHGAQLFTTIHTGRNRRATTAPIWVA
jgi:hypothetical protein